MAMADDDESDTNLPGLTAFEDYFNILREGWEGQKSIWNTAWSSMLEGKYNLQKMARDYAKSYQAQYRVAERLFRFPVTRMLDAEVPAWVNFDLRSERLPEKITHSNLTKTTPTREFNPKKVNLKVTELDPFGPNDYNFTIAAQEVGSHQIKVKIVQLKRQKALEIDLTSDDGPKQLKERKDNPPRDAPISGQYLGMVFDLGSEGQSGPPFAVVSVLI